MCRWIIISFCKTLDWICITVVTVHPSCISLHVSSCYTRSFEHSRKGIIRIMCRSECSGADSEGHECYDCRTGRKHFVRGAKSFQDLAGTSQSYNNFTMTLFFNPIYSCQGAPYAGDDTLLQQQNTESMSTSNSNLHNCKQIYYMRGYQRVPFTCPILAPLS